MMIIGEAWGEAEELAEAPFVGPSGYLLRKPCPWLTWQWTTVTSPTSSTSVPSERYPRALWRKG